MGVYSELYIDFIENYPQLIEGTEKFDFMFDMFIALKTTDGVKPNPLIAEFFKDVFCELHGGDILWAMASAGGYSYNFSFSTLDEALKGFTALLNYDVNLYYSPAIFKGWRKDKNVSRIKKSQQLLLHSDCSITEVSDLLGFENLTYYERVFKKYTGVTPLKYRKENGYSRSF